MLRCRIFATICAGLAPLFNSRSTIAAQASRSSDNAAAMSFSIWPAAEVVHFSVKSPSML